MNNQKQHGFTLIELLIVVAIIAILAAIAIPNFLMAQTRSKVAKVVSEMRTVATALESYYVDNNRYPLNSQTVLSEGIGGGQWLVDHLGDSSIPSIIGQTLTTPISYITSLPNDPFVFYLTETHLGYWFGSTMTYSGGAGTGVYWYGVSPTKKQVVYWQLASNGPDRDFNEDWRVNSDWPAGNWLEYDPTNGTVSDGNITRISGNTPGLGYF